MLKLLDPEIQFNKNSFYCNDFNSIHQGLFDRMGIALACGTGAEDGVLSGRECLQEMPGW